MEYIERITQAISYIEEHLGENVTIEQVSTQSAYSKYHFQRLFHYTAGETIGHYIVKRRLTEAVKELYNTQKTVTEIALRHGFESHEVFTRSFKKQFGITPYQFKKTGKIPKYLLKERIETEFLRNLQTQVIEAFEEKTLGHVKLQGFQTTDVSMENILFNWVRLRQALIPQVLNSKEKTVLLYGVIQYPDAFSLDLSYSYFASAESKYVGEQENDCIEMVLPASSYIVFNHKGSAKLLPYTYRYIYGTILTQSDYEMSHPFNFECYDEHFLGIENPDTIIKIWIPVHKKIDELHPNC